MSFSAQWSAVSHSLTCAVSVCRYASHPHRHPVGRCSAADADDGCLHADCVDTPGVSITPHALQ